MAFDDLDEAADEQSESSSPEQATETTSSTVEDEEETERETSDVVIENNDEQPDPYEEPAFPYQQGEMQTTIYVRSDIQDKWKDAKDFEVARILKREQGLRDVQGREYDDALFRLGADHPELVAKYVMEARGIDVPEDLGEE